MARLKAEVVHEFPTVDAWERWLEKNHASEKEAWLRFAKKGSGRITVTRPQALEVALTYGWIDGQALTQDEEFWLQRFTPRRKRSKWSKINCELVEKLIEAGRMKPAGLAQIEAAKADGRWDAAYAPPSRMEVPEDLAARLRKNRAAKRAFEGLDSRNRFAILYRIADAKRSETRIRGSEKYVEMLARGERL